MRRLALLVALLALAACGLKDDLYLPEPEKPASTQPQADEDAEQDENAPPQ
jgi:predicted small lipoprotein YifL